MKSFHWLMLLCLFGAIALLVVAPMDAPGTTFNEMDTPVAVSHPTLPQVRVTPPSPGSQRVVEKIILAQPLKLDAAFHFEETNSAIRARGLQNLLCVFLI